MPSVMLRRDRAARRSVPWVGRADNRRHGKSSYTGEGQVLHRCSWFRVRVNVDDDGVPVGTIWGMNTPAGSRIMTVVGTGDSARVFDVSDHVGRWITKDHEWSDSVNDAYRPMLGNGPDPKVS